MIRSAQTVARERLDSQQKRLQEVAGQKEFCTTVEAAQILDLAPGTIKKMIESGVLDAWKTDGGHRRIRVSSLANVVQGHLTGQTTPSLARRGETIRLSILAVGFDAKFVADLQAHVKAWLLPIELAFVNNAIEAALHVGMTPPDILLVQVPLPGGQSGALIDAVVTSPVGTQCDVVCVTGKRGSNAEELASQWIAASYALPLPYPEFRAFVQARLAQIAREARKHQLSA